MVEEVGELHPDSPPGLGLGLPHRGGTRPVPLPPPDAPDGRPGGLPGLDGRECLHEIPPVRQVVLTGALHQHVGGGQATGLSNTRHDLIINLQIAKKVFLFLGLYFSTLLGFTFVFILIQGEDFSPEPQTFVRSVSMMVGELEYADTFGKKEIIINTIVFLFIIVIPIVMNNLLIGLTVDNVQDLTKDACLKGLESKIKAISAIDKSFIGKVHIL